MTMRTGLAVFAGCVLFASTIATSSVARADDHGKAAERGRYLVTIGGCNDCHSPDGFQKGPTVPLHDWLTGMPVGFQGPWGTTYPPNLRLFINGLSESQWLEEARKERMPPMPWLSLRAMSDADLKAIYAFVRSLGPAGVAAPAYVAPGGKVTTPYIVFVPQEDRKQASAH